MNKRLLALVSILVLVFLVVAGFLVWFYFIHSSSPKNEPKSEEFVKTFAGKVSSAVIFRDWNEQYSYLSPDDQKRIEKEKFVEIQNSGESLVIQNGYNISSINIDGDIAKVRYLINVTNALGDKIDVPLQLDFQYINGKWYEPMPKAVESWLSQNSK